MKRSIVAAALALVLVFFTGNTQAYALTSTDVQKELMCQCGCTMVVDVCDCEQAEQIREIIAQKIGEGQTKEQIVGYFVAEYGEKVLSAPTKKGFNLTVWIVPFVAIAAGGVAIYFILRKWAWKGRTVPEPQEVSPQSEEELDEYRRKFRKEFETFSKEEKG